ncbi:GTP-binding protein [Jannaschia sp. S6380]|uniref:CobW family GTP-binding protein n=1 Tax=Jannaschia sp. S6380 TaxID=2926408 RepID=UPI001FF2D41B|nr:CobW family GTP-binding protein [Jannaschia sp. S6380]MCK0167207.1 GTP-binding protein [Jannaschia sp. S6380]
MTLPLTILGGYLGAGKTTLVNHLLRHSGRRLAILVNEFGDLAIDADLIEAEEDDLIALAGGCVCCSYGDDLTEALIALSRRVPLPEHIVLEASGVAMPGAIAATAGLIDDLRIAGIVGLVDATRIDALLSDEYLSDTIARQVAAADLLVVTRTDLVPADAARTRLAALAPGAPVVVGGGAPECDMILADLHGATRHDGNGHGAAHRSRVLPMDAPVDPQRFARALGDDPKVVRAKGHLRGSDGRTMTLQLVGDRFDLAAAPEGASPGIVVISVP